MPLSNADAKRRSRKGGRLMEEENRVGVSKSQKKKKS